MHLYSLETLHSQLSQSPKEMLIWNSQKSAFYARYPTELASSAEATTLYSRFDMQVADNPKQAILAHTAHMWQPTIALVGAGNFRPQTPEYRFAQAIKPKKIITLEPYAIPDGPRLKFTNYRHDITKPLQPELVAIADIATLFDSVLMDIAPGALISAFIHLNQLLKNGGIIAFDINLGYTEETIDYHLHHPRSPRGIFRRSWNSLNPHKPIVGKFMRIDKILLHSLASHTGFSLLGDYNFTTRSITHDQSQHHSRLTSIWQKEKSPTNKLLALLK